MLKILHFGVLKSINPGVKKQLDYESIAARETHSSHTIIYFSHSLPDREYMKNPPRASFLYNVLLPKKLSDYIRLRVYAYLWLLRNQKNFEIILIRYPLGDVIFSAFSVFLKPFYTIHHTKEVEEIKSKSGLIFNIQLLMERFAFRMLRKKLLGFVGVTNEIAQYQVSRAKVPKRVEIYPNGILTKSSEIKDFRSDKVKLCLICNREAPWHGIRRVFIQIEESKRQDFEIYFVGSFSSQPGSLKSDTRVHFTGHLNQCQLEQLLPKIDLCVGPFGLDSIGLNEACPLKTRESLQHGIPVFADYKDACFSEQFPYFLSSKFNVDKAIDFANRNRKIEKTLIAESSQKYISKTALYGSLYRFLEEGKKNN